MFKSISFKDYAINIEVMAIKILSYSRKRLVVLAYFLGRLEIVKIEHWDKLPGKLACTRANFKVD